MKTIIENLSCALNQSISFFTGIWFLNSFLPGFLATVLGILLGLPASIYINKKANRQAEKRKRKDNNRILKETLGLLQDNFINTRTQLENYLDLLNNQNTDDTTIIMPPEIDISIWDILKDSIADLLNNQSLKQEISLHFQMLKSLLKFHDLYLEHFTGVMSTFEGGDHKPQLKAKIMDYTKTILFRLTPIKDKIDREHSEIKE
jgi:hypothetical protein